MSEKSVELVSESRSYAQPSLSLLGLLFQLNLIHSPSASQIRGVTIIRLKECV